MPGPSLTKVKANDPRWFIWTIVFLLVSGVSLVSYIMITSDDITENSFLQFPAHRTKK
jgi:hypothetical protein